MACRAVHGRGRLNGLASRPAATKTGAIMGVDWQDIRRRALEVRYVRPVFDSGGQFRLESANGIAGPWSAPARRLPQMFGGIMPSDVDGMNDARDVAPFECMHRGVRYTAEGQTITAHPATNVKPPLAGFDTTSSGDHRLGRFNG